MTATPAGVQSVTVQTLGWPPVDAGMA